MEEALRVGEERYRALFQNIPIGVGIATIDGKIVAYNEMMQKITGYSKYCSGKDKHKRPLLQQRRQGKTY